MSRNGCVMNIGTALAMKVSERPNAFFFVIVIYQITDYATSVVLHHYSATDPTAQVRGLLVSSMPLNGWFWLLSPGQSRTRVDEGLNYHSRFARTLSSTLMRPRRILTWQNFS